MKSIDPTATASTTGRAECPRTCLIAMGLLVGIPELLLTPLLFPCAAGFAFQAVRQVGECQRRVDSAPARDAAMGLPSAQDITHCHLLLGILHNSVDSSRDIASRSNDPLSRFTPSRFFTARIRVLQSATSQVPVARTEYGP